MIRLGELLGALSLATDAAVGIPPESAMRTCLLATRLGRELGTGGRELQGIYFASLLRHLGCTGFAHEEARAGGGDDGALLAAFEDVDTTRPLAMASRALARVGRGTGVVRRVRTLARFFSDPGGVAKMAHAHCAQAVALAALVGVGDDALAALGQIYERYDGKGGPALLAGEEVSFTARVLHVANVAEIHARLGGVEAATDAVRRRSGRHLDPRVARAFVENHAALLAGLEGSVWDLFLEAEPAPARALPAEGIADVALAFAHYVDLKSPFTLGHSVGVAALAREAARVSALPPSDAQTLVIAALLHDLGRVSVPNGVWDKPGSLNAAEWERVRLHAYHTERILSRAAPLRDVAAIAGFHHERLDGSGYHRGASGAQVGASARLLAACDAYHAMTERRSFRPAGTAEAAARALAEDAGRLGGAAVDAVLAAAGHVAPRVARDWPAGLSDREVDVLGLLARGLSNKEIATALAISAKTVQHHVAHVYEKTGVGSRAAAALYATTHGLLPA